MVLLRMILACLILTGIGQASFGQISGATYRHSSPLPHHEPFCYTGCNKAWYLPEEIGTQLQLSYAKPIVIAVIDDGFRLTHQDLAPFLYRNLLEKDNGIDDDGNGYVDDITGWDVSDNDADVSFPGNRAEDFYHGTYIAGIIAKTLTEVYGDEASQLFKILPIKALSNQAGYLAILDGYKGMEYAAMMKPDIICTAWGANVIKAEDKVTVSNILNGSSNITLLASAGNMSDSREVYPAALPGVIAVAGVDSNKSRIDVSTSGRFVDVSAPGKDICGASIFGNDQYISCKGTSPAVAIATAYAAIIKRYRPFATSEEIERILKATSKPIDEFNLSNAGRMGAGLLDLTEILDYLSGTGLPSFNSRHPEGVIRIEGSGKEVLAWKVAPAGDYIGIEFRLDKAQRVNFKNAAIRFTSPLGIDTTVKLMDWMGGRAFMMQGGETTLELDQRSVPKNVMATIGYEMIPIDSTTMFCKDIQYHYDTAGIVEDGSGAEEYVNLTGCKWLITAPEGKHIEIEILEMDTERNRDNLMIFAAETAIPEYMLARLSGDVVPPKFNTHTNKVLLFFTSDEQNTGQGWKLKYTVK